MGNQSDWWFTNLFTSFSTSLIATDRSIGIGFDDSLTILWGFLAVPVGKCLRRWGCRTRGRFLWRSAAPARIFRRHRRRTPPLGNRCFAPAWPSSSAASAVASSASDSAQIVRKNGELFQQCFDTTTSIHELLREGPPLINNPTNK